MPQSTHAVFSIFRRPLCGYAHQGPRCQPAIRDFVGETGVNAEYHATNTGKTYKWKRMPDSKVLQTEKAGSKIKAFIYNLITRRRKPSKC